jgi:hypothetical protein
MMLGTLQMREIEELLDAKLLERVAALEARVSGEAAARVPESLQAHNAKRLADSLRLLEEIARLLEADSGPRRGAGKRIWLALADTETGRIARPSLRAVQYHIAQLRNTAVLRL